MKKMIRFVTLMLCIALLTCGCGGGQNDAPDQTDGGTRGELFTQPTETRKETEPEPVYEKQTVYLCTMEKMTLHENGAVNIGYNIYDEYGRKIESYTVLSDGTKTASVTYAYDEFGNNITETSEYGHYERTYDEAGRMLSELYYSAEGTCFSECHYTYNEAGYVTERKEITRYSEEVTYIYEVTYSSDYSSAYIETCRNGEKTGYTQETYNAAGQVILTKSYTADGKWTFSCESTYDAEGRLILEYNKTSSETQADYQVIYTYDENGLLLSKDADYYYGHVVEYTYEAFEILVRVN